MRVLHYGIKQSVSEDTLWEDLYANSCVVAAWHSCSMIICRGSSGLVTLRKSKGAVVDVKKDRKEIIAVSIDGCMLQTGMEEFEVHVVVRCI